VLIDGFHDGKQARSKIITYHLKSSGIILAFPINIRSIYTELSAVFFSHEKKPHSDQSTPHSYKAPSPALFLCPLTKSNWRHIKPKVAR
jgi:hypothetical protein